MVTWLVNAVRRWREDRSVPDGSYLQQLRAVYARRAA